MEKSRTEILKKGVALLEHAERGDNPELAKKKFDEYCMDNNIDFVELNNFRNNKKKQVQFDGQVFNGFGEFQDYYKKQSFTDKVRLGKEFLKILSEAKQKKNAKENNNN